MYRLVAVVVGMVLALGLLPAGGTADTTLTGTDDVSKRYLVVLKGTVTADGFDVDGSLAAVRTAVAAAGGSVEIDLTRQIGVLVVDSANKAFAETLRASGLVEEAAEDFKWKALPDADELTVLGAQDVPGGGPEVSEDPLEPLQWSMRQIRAPEAHAVQAGRRAVDVGILDSGIDGTHQDFVVDTAGTNVDCARGRDFVPSGPGVGNPNPCTDNQFHGTHVAGIVAAQANGLGVVGVAPNVTLVPVKVCDTAGYCYSSATAAGITYAGDAKLDVVNMSFFVDDDDLLESTEFKCMSDPVQRAFRRANERAIRYARTQGVVPVAALGNSDNDLANPPEPYTNECEVVPAETQGVIGTSALGRDSEKAGYSNYGDGPNDVSAPGGNGTTGDCATTVLSTIPGGWGCIQGTSMASPHAAGVAALIVSQLGRVGSSGDVRMSPAKVASYLQQTTVDIGETGYDECFGHGRIDALRAVLRDTSTAYDASAPFCPEYEE